MLAIVAIHRAVRAMKAHFLLLLSGASVTVCGRNPSGLNVTTDPGAVTCAQCGTWLRLAETLPETEPAELTFDLGAAALPANVVDLDAERRARRG